MVGKTIKYGVSKSKYLYGYLAGTILYKYNRLDALENKVEDLFTEEDVEALGYLFNNRCMIQFIIDFWFLEGNYDLENMLEDFRKYFDLEKGCIK